MSIKPVPGTTYYLKEVKDTMYLQPYLHYTYKIDSGKVMSLFLFSDIDDLNYSDTGFVIATDWDGLKDENGGRLVRVSSQVTINTGNGLYSVTLKPNTVFGSNNVKGGYLSYLQVYGNKSSVTLEPEQNIWQYWKTPDGLYVSGTLMRYYTGIDHIGGEHGLSKHEFEVKSYILEVQSPLSMD